MIEVVLLDDIETANSKSQNSADEGRSLTSCAFSEDEIDDVWYVLESAYRIQNFKVQTFWLELLLDPIFWDTKKARNIGVLTKILEQEPSKSLHKIQGLAQELKVSIAMRLNQADYVVTLGNGDWELSEIEKCKESGTRQEESGVDKPISLRVWMFQLGESNNLERITNVLQNMKTYSRDHLHKLWDKYDLHTKLIKIVHKYCNGDYGFDWKVSKQGIFQLSYMQIISKTFSSDYLVDKLSNSNFFDLYTQLIEEALIYVYDYTYKMDMPENCKIFEFLNNSLSIYNLMLSYKYVNVMDEVMELLMKIQDKLFKISQKETTK